MLLKYCGAADESTLPPIYNLMANCKKPEQVSLVQFNLSTRADYVGWAPPIASPELVQAIFGMLFTSPDVDNLMAAINVFHIIPSNDSRAGGVRERQNVYSMVFLPGMWRRRSSSSTSWWTLLPKWPATWCRY